MNRYIEKLVLLAAVAVVGCDAGERARGEESTSARQALGTGTGLRAEYFDNQDLTAPKVTRTDATVDFSWGTGSPDPSIAADSFSVRWTGFVEPLYSETYTFSFSSDDGARVWVNGVLLVDAWVNGAAERNGTIALTAGQKVPVQVEYYESSSSAVAKLSWASASQPKQLVPSSQLYLPEAGSGTGLWARLYDNQDLTGLKVSRAEGPVNFSWGSGSPDPSIAADSFSSRWSGVVEPLYSETYTFYTLSDDGVRLWVDGVLLIDNWTNHTAVENRATVNLTAGRRHAIQLDHYDYSSTSTLKLSWSSPTQAKQIIPASQLYPAFVPEAAPQLAGTLSAPASGATGTAISLAWTVTNHGTATAQPGWHDTVYLSTDAVLGGDTVLTGVATARTASLAPGASYTVTKSVTLPRIAPGSYHLIFKTDLEDNLFESDETDNHVAVPLTVLGADLVPSVFTAPARAANGERVAMTWTLGNTGTATANGQWYTSYPASNRWYDKVFLSTDATWDAADTFVGEVARINAPLDVGASYTVKTDLQLPKVYAEGPAFLLLAADKNGDVVETDEVNNTYALPITMDRQDLVAQALTAPGQGAPGELVALTWTVHNGGTGTAHGQWYSSYPGSYRWYDKVYLSTDTTWDAADTLVGEVGRINAPLAAGASYTASATMQLPAVANGAWYLLAVADKNGDLNEKSEDNNTVAVPITIGRADLVVDAFTGPESAANGERVALSWTARNAGTNTASGKWYSSYPGSYRWYDKVYLSTDAVWDSADTFVGEVARTNAPLNAGASYTTSATLQLPKVYAEGAAFLIVALDKNGDVSEQGEDNNTFSIPLTLNRSDLVAEAFTAPAEVAPGELASLSWTVRNGGTGKAHGQWYSSYPGSDRWYDKVYLSADGVLDAADTLVGEVGRANAPLNPGASYTVTTTMQVPAGMADGAWSLLVVTDANGDVNEQVETNNISVRSIAIGRADLVADVFTAPESAANGQQVALTWTARNAGSNTANGKWYSSYPGSYRWYDKVYLSTDGVLDAADTLVGEVARASAPLAAGASYTATATLQLPKVYAEGAAFLIVALDKNGDVSEQREDNNTFVLPFTVTRSDLVAEAFTGPAEVAPGELASLSWTVSNAGNGTAHGQWYSSYPGSYRWYDRVYLSTDGVLDAADTLVGEVARANAPLAAGASYTVSTTMQIPSSLASGAWSLLVVIDSSSDVNEQSETNNVAVRSIALGRADLVVDAFTGPESAANGERVALSWTARNAGTNTANGKWYSSYPGSYRWYDKVYLSTDAVWDSADTFVGEVARTSAPLNAGASYTTSATLQLPKVYAEGAAFLIVALDKNGDVSEQGEDNNTFSIPLTLTRSDLVAESFTAPAEAAPGELASLSWTVRNGGTGKAHGQWYSSYPGSDRWYDRVYLSADGVLDAADVLVGEVARANAPVDAGASYTVTTTMQLPSTVADGAWSLLVAIDSSSDVNEQSETNNVSIQPITIGRADLVAEAFTSPESAANGEQVMLSWTVLNAGSNTANGKWYSSYPGSYRWYDKVYLSTDAVWDVADTFVGEVARASAPLTEGARYTTTTALQLPEVYPEGLAYLIVTLDKNGDVSEQREDNNVFALPITVTRPDLVADNFTAPAEAAAGELAALSWTVRNAGTGKAHGQWYSSYPGSYRWYDKVYLSTDGVVDAADIFVGEVARTSAPLAAGATYTVSTTMQLPSTVADGAWSLLVVTDANSDVNEQSETDNVFARPLTIGRADLVAEAFTGPESAANGEQVALSWTVRNTGSNTANGKWYSSYPGSYRWYDKVYLSTDAVWDSADTFVGEVARTSAPLAAEGSYTTNATLQLPKVYAEGAAFLIVTLDKNGDVSEQGEDNNTFAIPLTLNRSNLVAEAFTAPADAAPGELAALSWTVRNGGTGTAHGQWYSSYPGSYRWYDKVYLSTDGALDAADIFVGEVARTSTPLAAGASYTVTTTMQVPSSVASGDWSLLLVTDSSSDVNEQSETDNLFVLPLKVGRADLVAEAFTGPASAANGEQVALTWTARNAGSNTANGKWYSSYPGSYRWYDKVYLSTDGALDSADTFVGEVARTNAPLAAGASYTATATLQLPKVYAEGAAFLIVALDKNGDVSEQGEDNNTFAIPLTLNRSDLVAEAFTAPESAAPRELISLSWTARNAGTGKAHGQWYSSYPGSYRWYDRVYLSADGVLDAEDTLVGEVARANAPVEAGASYTVTTTMQVPAVDSGTWFLLAVIDQKGDVTEQQEGNNLFTLPISIGRSDLLVDGFIAPSQAAPGELVTFSVLARNAGTHTASGRWYSSYPGSYRWYDKVYLSTDAVLDVTDTLVGEVARSSAPLAAAATYNLNATLQVPSDTAPGSYYFLAALDQNGDVSESDETNNVSLALAVTISRADLVVDAFSGPAAAATGEPVSLTWTVRNIGTGKASGRYHTSYPASYRWSDRVFLSTDEVLDAADLLVGERAQGNAPLAPGASYTATASLALPPAADGSYFLLVTADGNGDVSEEREDNNVLVASAPISVSAPDLRPVALNGPDSSLTQVPVTLSWTVTNDGAGAAVPTWNDDIYLTADGDCCGDSNDVRVTSVSRTPDLAPGASYTATVTVELPNVPTGPYHLVVRTKSGTSMFDANDTNNTLSRPIEIFGTVEEPIISLDGTPGSGLKSPRFSADGSRLAVADGPRARVFEMVTFTERGVFGGHTAALDSLAFSPTGDRVLSGAQDGTARIWDSITLAETTSLSSSTGPNLVAYSADGAQALVGNGTAAKLYDAVTGELLRSFTGHTSTVTAVALSEDGTLVATGSADRTARLWNAATGALVRTLSGHTAQVSTVAFSPDGGELLTASHDGTLRFWSLETGAQAALITQGSRVGEASWSSDGQYVVSVDEATVAPGLGYLWKRSTLEGVRSFYHYHENDCIDPTRTCNAGNRTPGKLTGIALSPDNTMVVGTQANGKIRVWPSSLPAIIPDTTVTLTPGVGAPITLRPNTTYHFRVDAAAWDSLVVRMDGMATAGATFAANAGTDPLAVQMLANHGTSPSAASHEHSTRAYASRIQAGIPLVNSRAGTYYVSLTAPFLTSGAITGTLTVRSDTFELASVAPHRVGNAGRSTFAVKGTGLTASTQVELVSPSGTVVPSTRVLDLDHDTLGFTADLTGAEVGAYTVRVTNPLTGATSTLPASVNVAAGTGGQFRAWMEGPTAVRGSTVRPLKVRWKNDGDADLAAPILVISTSAGQALLDANWVAASAMQVIASGEGFPGDVLPPGAEGSFTFEHRFPNVSGTTTIQVGQASEDHATFDWAALKPGITPPDMVGDATWDAVWSDSTAAIGTTRKLVAATLRRANANSSSPASIEAAMGWVLWTQMSQHPLAKQAAGAEPEDGLAAVRGMGDSPWDWTGSAGPEDVLLNIIRGAGGGGAIDPGARTFVLSHGWNGNPSAFNDLAQRIARDYPGANIVAVDWSKLAGTGIFHPIRASRNGSIAGAQAAQLLRQLGITDNITHVTHSHGQFVAEGIAKAMPNGTHKLLALDAANPFGHGFKRPDYSVFKGGAGQLVNPWSPADDLLPHKAPRGFADGRYATWAWKDWVGHNGAKRMATNGPRSIDDLLDAVRSGQLGRKFGFRGSLLLFGLDLLICGDNNLCSFSLALLESLIFWNPTPLILWGIFTVLSLSPEEIHGPAANGETVSRALPWNYSVVFWNSAKAAGPVQDLIVIEYLDPNLDWSSVDFNIVEYGGRSLTVPDGVTTSWSIRDLPPVNGCTMVGMAEGQLAVDITLDYDPQTGRIEWRLKVVDTALEDFPWDPYAGILPPPDEKLCGRGHVTYTVRPKSDVSDGSAVSAKAGVIFDTNPVSYTNTVTHYIGP